MNDGELLMSEKSQWQHPGGKFRELGPDSTSDADLLAILISPGLKDRPAAQIADDILAKFGSFKGMANQPLSKLMKIKGLGEVKAIRIAAAFEIARRIVNEVLKEHEKT
jgi:DNA repair protein RadC